MKLIIILLFLPAFASSQQFKISDHIPKSRFTVEHIYYIVLRDSLGKQSSIEQLKDGTYIIEGDTVALIKALIENNEKTRDLSQLKTKAIESAADWANDVSDYFKIGNDKFTEYLKLLNKLGYTGWIKTIRYTKPKKERTL